MERAVEGKIQNRSYTKHGNMAGLVFLLVFWVLAGACQRHGVGGFIV